MSNICLIISVLCLNFVQMLLLFRYAQISRDLADCLAFKDAVLEGIQDAIYQKVEENIDD